MDDLSLERDDKLHQAMVVVGMKPSASRSKRAIMAAMTKVHQQFRQAQIRNIASLFNAYQVAVDPKVLDEVSFNFECDTCIRYEVKKWDPVVEMPRDPMCNREIAADVF